MPSESDVDLARADAIALRICMLINDTKDRSNDEVLAALMMAIAHLISSIDCRDCRAAAVKSVKKTLPKFISFAIEQKPINRPSNHVH
jgi:hypothetical protein